MVLDLNGNGLEAIIPNSGYAVRFDHEGDGSKTGTGWISANDAFLVLDRNGNGVVDDGRELFGDNTPKNLDGTLALTMGKASNGFDALRQEDTNHDGVVDASDTRFADLRLWQDLNQDGISQTGELSTLASHGITSLSLNSTANSQVTGGNRISDLGTYTTTDGATHTLGDIDLADQPFIRTFNNPLPVSAAAGALPDMQGSGWVRDLREAMSSSNGAPSGTPAAESASNLVSAVAGFSAGTTRAAQRSQLDAIVQAWALTTGTVKFDNLGSNIWYDTRLDGYGYKVRYATDPADPMLVYNFAGLKRIQDGTGIPGPLGYDALGNLIGYINIPPVYTEGYEAMTAKLKVLEVFNAQPFVNPPRGLAANPAWTDKPSYLLHTDNEPPIPGSGGLVNGPPSEFVYTVNLSQAQVDYINLSYDALIESTYQALATQTRLAAYMDQVELTFDASNNLSFNFAPLEAKLDTLNATDRGNAIIDLAELLRFDQQSLRDTGWLESGLTKLQGYAAAAQADINAGTADAAGLSAAFADMGIKLAQAGVALEGGNTNEFLLGDRNANNTLRGNGGNDFILGGNGNDNIDLGAGENIVFGGAGNDHIDGLYGSGLNGADFVDGGSGDDTIDTREGNDIIFGGAGNDALSGNAGDDDIRGGAGDDQITGGGGSDIYHFGRGDGHDFIGQNEAFYGPLDKMDVLSFDAGIRPEDIYVSRQPGLYAPVTLTIRDTGDSVRIGNVFGGGGPFSYIYTNYPDIEQVRFADGTIWDRADLKRFVLESSTEGNDNLQGFENSNDTINGKGGNDAINGLSGNDVLLGGAGNDSLAGGEGNDVLDGGTGDDLLSGSEGDDTLDGGAGNDNMDGNEGADTYLFGRGDGFDWVFSRQAENIDVLRFKAGITPGDIALTRFTDSLQFTIKDTGERIRIGGDIQGFNLAPNGMSGPYQLKEVQFADGTVWSRNYLHDLLLDSGTEGNDNLQGFENSSDTINGKGGNDIIDGLSGNDVLFGGDGDDSLVGAEGNDVLDGGAGNDAMDGNEGTDTYLFGYGDGADRIDSRQRDNNDVLRFKAGVRPEDVSFVRDGNNGLTLALRGSGDSITLGAELANLDIRLEGDGIPHIVKQVEFADGTVWDWPLILDRMRNVRGTEGDDVLSALPNVASNLYGLGGNDILTANIYGGTLDGGDGNDILTGGHYGVSTLIGGAGDDQLRVIDGTGILSGGDGNDVLFGAGASDTLDGGAGDDLMYGGGGEDTYVIRRNEGFDTIVDGGPYGPYPNRLLLADMNASDLLSFERASNDLDLVFAGSGRVRIADGARRIGTQITSVEFADGTVRAFTSLLQDKGIRLDDGGGLFGNLRNAPAFDAKVIGGNGDDTIYASDGNDVLFGSGGNDFLAGGDGADTIFGGAGDDVLTGEHGNDIETGGAGNDTYALGLNGGSDIAYEDGGAGDNDALVLWQSSRDSISVRSDHSDLIVTIADGSNIRLVNQNAGNGAGVETVYFSNGSTMSRAELAALAPPANHAPELTAPLAARALVENQTFSFALPSGAFTDVDAGDTLTLSAALSTGDPLPAWLSFDPLTRTFSGLPDHASVLASAAGLGVKVTGTDSAGAAASGIFTIGVTQTVFTGGSGNDTLTGTQYNDVLDGGTGADRLAGGAGNDTYIVDNTGDVVIENANEGIDTVLSSISYTLGANLENLTLTGTANINATGNALANTLTGNAGNNLLNGGAGADTLIGGAGNDTYVIDNAGDVVIESAGEGTDTVQSSITYTLGANLERLTLTGTGAINGTGNELDNILTGNGAANILTGLGGNDTLNGGAGADTLIGGNGNDTYVIDNAGDVVIENANEGTDTVQSGISYTLGANLENLTLTGTAANSGSGNDLDNLLTGNAASNTLSGGAGNDTLNGGAGADTLIGGTGNDTYIVDSAGDVVVEAAGEGIDQVNSSVSYTLSTNVENLTLTGSAAISGSGNELNNLLIGNNAANTLSGGGGDDVLDGKGGADTLIGGTGNDTYVINSALDVVIENGGEGVDQVNASATYTLGANLEILTLTGSANISGTGNSENNLIRGNAGNNTLNGAGGIDLLEGNAGADKLTDNGGTDNGYYNGGAGNDTIAAGAGNEMIIGGTGNDTISTGGGRDVIAFNRGDGADILNASAGHDDTLSLGGGIGYADLALRKSGNNLILDTGAGESITMKNWYSTTVNGGDNKSVLNLQVIADAMSNFNASSNDPLLNKRVETFNFAGIVSAFDAQRLATPGLSSWALSNALLNFHLSGSDSAAIGGDLAYQYGHAGSNAGIGMQSAFDNLAAQGFGVTAQTLKPFSGLQEGLVKLA